MMVRHNNNKHTDTDIVQHKHTTQNKHKEQPRDNKHETISTEAHWPRHRHEAPNTQMKAHNNKQNNNSLKSKLKKIILKHMAEVLQPIAF